MKRVSKYVNQTKVINGISFTTVSYLKGKVEVVAYGYVGSMWVGTQTWKTKENGANVTKRSGFHSESKRFKESFVANEKPSSLLPIVYEPIRKNFIGETDDESMEYICKSFVGCESIREIRNVYKRFAKMYHPDSLGRELFPHELLVHEHVLKVMRDGAINQFRAYNKVMAEWEDDEELPVEDLMKMWDITEEDLMEE